MANNFKFLDAAGLTKVWNKINSVFAKKSDVNGEQNEWDSDASYSAGDYVVYGGKLWMCKLTNRGQTPSEGTYWIQVSLKQLKSDLSNEIYKMSKSATLANSNTNIVTGELYYQKIGNVCFVDGYVNVKAAAANAVVFENVPKSKIVNAPLAAITGADDTGGYYCFATNNAISIKVTRAGTYRIGGSYICE